jgi:hypothetical protein
VCVGPPQGWQRGARVLQYNFSGDTGPAAETWVRLEDGTLLDNALETELHAAQTTCSAGLQRCLPQTSSCAQLVGVHTDAWRHCAGTDFCDTHSDAPSCASERAEL